MLINIKELFDKNFDSSFQTTIYQNIKTALEVLEQFKKENEKFFSFDKKETLFGHLRTYVIEKQIYNSAFVPNPNYSVYMKKANKYKHKTLYIETEDFVINLGCTSSEHKLLPASAYKKELALSNAGLNIQLTLDYPKTTIIDSKKYAEITYGYKYGDLQHLNILLPSSDYKSIIYSANLLSNAKIHNTYTPEIQTEETIVSLKKSLSDELYKII